jgi:hypothetical protein
VLCKQQECSVRLLSHGGKSNSTLRDHFKRHSSKLVNSSPQPATITRHFPQKLSASLKQTLSQSLALMCAVDGRAFNTVSGEGFKYAMQMAITIGAKFGCFDVFEAMPTPETIANNVHYLTEKIETKLKEILKDIPAVAITTDHYKDSVSQVFILLLLYNIYD